MRFTVVAAIAAIAAIAAMFLPLSAHARVVDARQGGSITLTYVVGGYTTGDLSKFAAVVDKVQGLQLGGLGAHLSGKTR